jgi:hydrogenase nickel incorporation protein HypA/HybF
MHELSIAVSIVETVEREVRNAGGSRVDELELEIGKLSGIQLDSLEFVWSSATKNSLLEGISFSVHQIAGQGKCLSCGNTFPMDDLYGQCPECKEFFIDIVKGKELKIKRIIAS